MNWFYRFFQKLGFLMEHRYFFPILGVLLLGLNYQWFINQYHGKLPSIDNVERKKLDLPEISEKWIPYPNLREFNPLQFWINPNNSKPPKHHAKYFYENQDAHIPQYELDLYLLKSDSSENIYLEIGYFFGNDSLQSSWHCFIKRKLLSDMTLTDSTYFYTYDLLGKDNLIDSLSLEDAKNIIDSLHLDETY